MKLCTFPLKFWSWLLRLPYEPPAPCMQCIINLPLNLLTLSGTIVQTCRILVPMERSDARKHLYFESKKKLVKNLFGDFFEQ